MSTVTEYTPLSGRLSYSIASDDGTVRWLVTPETGPGQFSPIRAWVLWRSDALSTKRRYAGTDAGRDKAIRDARALADRNVTR